MNVLIAYATKSETTRGVAERVAARLSQRGMTTTMVRLPATVDAGRFDAVVLGSAVYSGAWLPEAPEFARRQITALASRPVWTFSVGVLAGQRGLLRRLSWPDAKEAAELNRVLHARDHRFFGGSFHPTDAGTLQRLVFRLAGGRYGDFRDWKQIDTWADGIATALQSPTQGVAVTGEHH